MLLNKDISYSDKGDEFENGKKIEIGDIKVVNLKGTWREMGRQYGHLMKKELEDLDTFLDLIIEALVKQIIDSTVYNEVLIKKHNEQMKDNS